MKVYRSKNEIRLWIENDEIENIVEDELRRAGLHPSTEAPVVNIEAFVERYLGVPMDQYHELPAAVLGQTEFFADPDAHPRILLNRDLTGAQDRDESPECIRARWRATIAHEASHVLFHRQLFQIDPHQQRLFAPTPEEDRQHALLRCLKRNIGFLRSTGVRDWKEVQANKGMAALLMPRRFFLDVVQREVDRLGRNSPRLVGHLHSHLPRLLETSRQAVAIRLETLCPVLLHGAGIPT